MASVLTESLFAIANDVPGGVPDDFTIVVTAPINNAFQCIPLTGTAKLVITRDKFQKRSSGRRVSHLPGELCSHCETRSEMQLERASG